MIPQTAGSKYPCIFNHLSILSSHQSLEVNHSGPTASPFDKLPCIAELRSWNWVHLPGYSKRATEEKILPLKDLKVHQLAYIDVCTTDINRRMTTRSWSRAAPVAGGMPGRWRAPGGVMLRETVAPWTFGYNDAIIITYHEVWMWWLTCLDMLERTASGNDRVLGGSSWVMGSAGTA